MITDLHIAGLALLNDCDLEIGSGLTAITGETGAGKTMLLTALRLLAGGRADPKRIKAGRSRTEVDAIMTVPETLAEELRQGGADVEGEEVTFSRTVTPTRSRAAIAGRPTTAATLARTVGSLVTIHGQADQLRLKSPARQRELLDAYIGGEHLAVLRDFAQRWERVARLRSGLEELNANRDRRAIELRYLLDLVAQVETLDPSPQEEDELHTAIERLDNIERLRDGAAGALRALSPDSETPPASPGGSDATRALGEALESLTRVASMDREIEEFAARARSLEAEVSGLAADLRAYYGDLIGDPQELGRLHQRRATLTELCRGRAADAAELLEWTRNAKERIEALQGDETDPAVAARRLETAETEMLALAHTISQSRQRAAAELERRVGAELEDLALGDAKLIVKVEDAPVSRHGADRVSILLQPHPSAPPSPLGEGASGGELSRVMLALEVVLAGTESAQTMVFDEVDAGIGGTTANHVGRRLADLARFHQVIVVTHLPQIAALANTNFQVSKRDGNATVRQVVGAERTDEIVRMLGGDDPTGAARRHALELESARTVAESKP